MSKKKITFLYVLCSLLLLQGCTEMLPFGFFGKSRINVNVETAGTKASVTDAGSGVIRQSIPFETESGDTFYLTEVVSEAGDAIGTKGTIIDDDNLGTADGFKSFGMDAYILNDVSELNPNEWIKDNAGSYPCYFTGGQANYSDGKWVLDNGSGSPAYTWLLHTDFAFWSYAPETVPWVCSREEVSLSAYTVPETVTDQQDLLVAYSGMNSGEGEDMVDIHFYHALATVIFKLNLEEGCELTGVSIGGAMSTGDLAVTQDSGMPVFAWSNLSNTEDVVYAQGFDEAADFEIDSKDGYKVQDRTADKVFFMIPQSHENLSVTISVKMSPGGTFTKTLSNIDVDWEPGKIYTYLLTSKGALCLDIIETMDTANKTKSDVSIKNTGLGNEYVRAVITGAWFDKNGNYVAAWDYDFADPESAGFVGLPEEGNTTGDWRCINGCYYYINAIQPGNTTASKLFTTFTAPSTTPVPGAHFEMVIHAQAVSYGLEGAGTALAEDAWGLGTGILTNTIESAL